MPKLGMEPKRRAALVDATIAEIGAARSRDITVARIARRAGMSPALAHHYFGSKETIFAAAMRRILRDFRAEVMAGLATAQGPRERLAAIVTASFAPSCFAPETIAAWTTFYVEAQTNPQAARLLTVYQRRLRSNLRANLRAISPVPERDAETLAALIDGLYLRASLIDGAMTPEEARAIALRVLGGMG